MRSSDNVKRPKSTMRPVHELSNQPPTRSHRQNLTRRGIRSKQFLFPNTNLQRRTSPGERYVDTIRSQYLPEPGTNRFARKNPLLRGRRIRNRQDQAPLSLDSIRRTRRRVGALFGEKMERFYRQATWLYFSGRLAPRRSAIYRRLLHQEVNPERRPTPRGKNTRVRTDVKASAVRRRWNESHQGPMSDEVWRSSVSEIRKCSHYVSRTGQKIPILTVLARLAS